MRVRGDLHAREAAAGDVHPNAAEVPAVPPRPAKLAEDLLRVPVRNWHRRLGPPESETQRRRPMCTQGGETGSARPMHTSRLRHRRLFASPYCMHGLRRRAIALPHVALCTVVRT